MRKKEHQPWVLGEVYKAGEPRPVSRPSDRKARELRELLKKPMPEGGK